MSYVGRDWNNTPSVIIQLATSGSLETIINNKYLNCFHSLCPKGSLLPPPSSRRLLPLTWVLRVPSHNKPFKHTSAHCRVVLFLQLSSTKLRAGLSLVSLDVFSHLPRVPIMLWDLPFVPLPDWFQRLWLTIGDSFPLYVLITSPKLKSPGDSPRDQVDLHLLFGFSYFFPISSWTFSQS